MEIRECIVKIYDADGVDHSVKIRAESVYEAALKGFERFDRLFPFSPDFQFESPPTNL